MIELPMILLAGVLGSSHCLGMCGGFALMVGKPSQTLKNNLLRQSVYTTGRIITYTLMGAMAGFAGWRLKEAAGWLVNAQAILALAAGALLIFEGLIAAGAFRWFPVPWKVGTCGLAGGFVTLLTAAHLRSVFVAGLFNGLLPCGLVYAFLVLAGSTACMPLGAATMATFGLGTAPAMLLAGWGGSMLRGRARVNVLRLAACCVVLTGVLTVIRGTKLAYDWDATDRPTCVFCNATAQPSSFSAGHLSNVETKKR